MRNRFSALSRTDRVLWIVTALSALVSFAARGNRWHLVVVEDALKPGTLAVASVALATICVRAALRLVRGDPASYGGIAPRMVVALAPYPLLLLGVVVLPVLAWPSAVDAAASVGRESPPDVVHPVPGTDLTVEIDAADCFFGVDGTVTVEARRGIRSRRIELLRDGRCVDLSVEFPVEATRTRAVLTVRAGCDERTFVLDARTLDIDDRADPTTAAGCVEVDDS